MFFFLLWNLVLVRKKKGIQRGIPKIPEDCGEGASNFFYIRQAGPQNVFNKG